MNRFALAMMLVLALAGCTSSPTSKQPVEADRGPCAGDGFAGGASNYARCIRHVATVASRCGRSSPGCVSIDG
jgi:hypothetical protein